MEDSKFEYSFLCDDRSLVVMNFPKTVVGGECAMQFTQSLKTLMTDGVKFLAVDLSNVEIINSSGLGMLVSGMTTLKANNSKFVLVNPSKKISELLVMTRLDKVFEVYSNLNEVIEKL